ncbi:MAG TPA: YjjI family glycine radical enzyme [Acidimicrobiia bacterium]|nr:YjjI family glycine radical enzyme [Acidimicrobiia bacterium]
MADDIRDRIADIVTSPKLGYRQRLLQLALTAEGQLPYPKLSADAERAMETGLVTDLFEGPAPYRPRYLLPDYAHALRNGSEYLELDAPADLEEAVDFLQILYHHVPSITSYPVYFGDLDTLLLPYLDDSWDEERLDRIMTRLWRFLDRTIPDAFAHANIGPTDNPIARSALRVDRALAQVVPNLTLKWDPEIGSDDLLREAAVSIAAVNKPHVANDAMIRADFPEGYGVVSCYNTLPLGGGSHTLVRLNLAESARRHTGSIDDFLKTTLPAHAELTFEVIEARVRYLVEEARFYEHSFLVHEGIIHPDRFTAMFGIFGMAELVDTLLPGHRYGHHDEAADLARRVIDVVAGIVTDRDVAHCRNGRATLHAQSGIDSDRGITAGARLRIGEEPELVDHILTVAPHHHHFASGISDIFALEGSVRANPDAIVDVTKGAFAHGMREMTFNVEGGELVRVTGYMMRRSDVERFREEGSRINSTVFAAGSVENWGLLDRVPRVISHEFDPRLSAFVE